MLLLFDGNVGSALAVFAEDLLTFVEELIALSVMHTFCMPNLAIAEIPVAERKPTLPVRFRVTLNEDAARRFVAATRPNPPGNGVPGNPIPAGGEDPAK